MAFGKRKNPQVEDDNVTHVSETQGLVDSDDEVVEVDETFVASASEPSASQASRGGQKQKASEEKDPKKPLLDEVTFNGAGQSKNPGGCKQWTCNHCHGKFTSTYTRIHVHFFGPPVGKRAEVKRCPSILRDRKLLERLSNKVREAESCGVSKTLKNSVLSKNASSRKRIEESFGIVDRNFVDLKIIRALCANGIPFNALRNPQFQEMVRAINEAPTGYMPPSCEKARTVLLDECVRDVEKDLIPVKDTWYSQGVSIVSDGWSNVKRSPLINVLAVNSRGAMFMYSEDFLGVQKTGAEISKFLLGAIETIGPSNVLQVVTDNAANCKAAGKEIEKVYKHIFWSPCCVHTLNLALKDMAKYTRGWTTWWKNILAITKPLFLLIKFADGEGPKMAEIYERMDNMVGEIKDVMRVNKFSIYFPEVEKIILARWEKMSIPLHCLGFALNPRFYDKFYLEQPAPGDTERKAPNLDKEVVVGVMDAFKRIGENEVERKMLREQFATFHMKKGIYARSATQADAVTMDPIDWWSTYGAETPQLAEVAKKVLSQPISSSSAERNWSTYSYIHNIKRNRLNSKRADKLVFIHSNIRLISRFEESYKSGPHKKWDMNPESSYIEGSNARLEDMAWEDLEGEDVDNVRV